MSTRSKAAHLLPQDVREMTDVALDDADNFCRNWLDAEQRALATLETQLAAARAGGDALAKQALAIAAKNLTSSFEFARRLMQAEDVNELVRLQLEFYQKEAGVFARQRRDLGETMAKASSAGLSTT